MVTAAIALTVCPLSLSLLLLSPRQLVFSFSKYVDWGAHFGGTIQGILSGVLVLTRELDNVYSKVLPVPAPLSLPSQLCHR
jgi:membrane associated rhomboid family serine protease